ncbi:DegT/DnrJ/EryC1/StrS family aminotransferase [Acidobacteriia bacterium AH_259_A11_L15]|nr:DegT/DnrJ/EryC1/StrS family aminotransferase [Acidobacteriia bacterium AH_259_A11_L15]
MEWKVRFVDYPSQFRKMEIEIMDTIKMVLSGGDLILRQQLHDFEAHLAAFVGTKYAVGVSNCTDALRLSLQAAGVGPGDEVISVSHTFVATAAAVHHVGATPVLVDVADDHNMNVDLLEQAITPRTKAILPVHLNGRLCNMGQLMAIAGKHKLLVIEDSAQALGASIEGKRGGSFGLAGCFSFYPAKLLGAFGDGGAVVTNNEEIAQKIRLLRDHGRLPDGEVAGWSFNCRLDNLQAALLDLKLKRVPEWIARRRQIVHLYQERLGDIPQLLLPPPPSDGPWFDIYQNYEIEAENRDGLLARLREQGIEVMIQWGGKGVHQFQALGLGHFKLPRTDRLFERVLMLPLHTELADEQLEFVCDIIANFYRSVRPAVGRPLSVKAP